MATRLIRLMVQDQADIVESGVTGFMERGDALEIAKEIRQYVEPGQPSRYRDFYSGIPFTESDGDREWNLSFDKVDLMHVNRGPVDEATVGMHTLGNLVLCPLWANIAKHTFGMCTFLLFARAVSDYAAESGGRSVRRRSNDGHRGRGPSKTDTKYSTAIDTLDLRDSRIPYVRVARCNPSKIRAAEVCETYGPAWEEIRTWSDKVEDWRGFAEHQSHYPQLIKKPRRNGLRTEWDC